MQSSGAARKKVRTRESRAVAVTALAVLLWPDLLGLGGLGFECGGDGVVVVVVVVAVAVVVVVDVVGCPVCGRQTAQYRACSTSVVGAR